jgi:hypothetical protein
MKPRPLALSIALSVATSLIALPVIARDCGCSDLPQMTRELTEQEFLQKKFQDWSEYMPRGIENTSQLRERAQTEFNAAFYSNNGSSAAGTTHGGHAHMGTDLTDASCPLVLYLYDSKGRALLDKNGDQRTRPVSEENFPGRQCAALVNFAFVHERVHQATCLKLVESGRTKSWESPAFFARDDASAYRAGADALRSDIKSLAGKCGWESSAKNRLPNVDEAKELAKRAAKARPARRRK